MTDDLSAALASIDEALQHKSAEKAWVRQQLRSIKRELRELRKARRLLEGTP